MPYCLDEKCLVIDWDNARPGGEWSLARQHVVGRPPCANEFVAAFIAVDRAGTTVSLPGSLVTFPVPEVRAALGGPTAIIPGPHQRFHLTERQFRYRLPFRQRRFVVSDGLNPERYGPCNCQLTLVVPETSPHLAPGRTGTSDRSWELTMFPHCHSPPAAPFRG